MFSVTLKELRDNNACVFGYNKLVCMLQGFEYTPETFRNEYIDLHTSEPISLLYIMNKLGLDDAIWSMRCIEDKKYDMCVFGLLISKLNKIINSKLVDTLDDKMIGVLINEIISQPYDVIINDYNEYINTDSFSLYFEISIINIYVDAMILINELFIKMCNNQAPWQLD